VPSQVLGAILEGRTDERIRPWWVESIRDPSDPERFLATFAGAGRRLGTASVALTESERSQLQGSEFAGLIRDGLPLAELGRIALLQKALDAVPHDRHEKLVDDVYRLGGHEEKIAVLRALSVLPDSERFIKIAADGVRTNAVEILAAIANDNPYPARHFSFDAFNQLVMKVVFNNLPLSKVVGLAARTNAELARMARDFADERRAAARPVPSDLHLIADFSQTETQK
jgi:hypothetical protein